MHSREQELVEDGGWCTCVCVAEGGVGWVNIALIKAYCLYVGEYCTYCIVLCEQ